jgi:UDP-N-acetylglucosamine 4,6-dehydratase
VPDYIPAKYHPDGTISQAQIGVRRVCIFSRDELKQAQMAADLPDPRLRFFLGDVRDPGRLAQACHGIDTVVHAAALKRVDAIAYNPSEVIKTNVLGTQNVVEAAAGAGVGRIIVVSSDKAVKPTNIYGASKFMAESAAVAANAWTHPRGTKVSAVRYGNVLGSRGSVVGIFRRQAAQGGPLRLTDPRCTRFWLTLAQAVTLIRHAADTMQGGEIFVPRLPSMLVFDLARAVAGEGMAYETVGLRPGGEKLHETLVAAEEADRTYLDGDSGYLIAPPVQTWGKVDSWGVPVRPGFSLESNRNDAWLTVDQMRGMLADVQS